MLYPELFKSLESARWDMEKDVPWDSFDASLLTDEQAVTIKMNAITEWSALPATEMFLRDNRDDSDFSAFMSIWFYEEQKHSLVLLEYLRRFRPDLAPTEQELHEVRFEFDPAPALETLMLHFCGEVRLTQWYRRASEWHTEPVIKQIYNLLSRDEARHGGAYLKYMKRAIDRTGDTARAAFSKIGMLMAASGRAGKPLHPTNLHVSKALYPARHHTVAPAGSRLAGTLAGRADPLRQGVRGARHRRHPAQPRFAVRRNLQDDQRPEPLPQAVRQRRLMRGGIPSFEPSSARPRHCRHAWQRWQNRAYSPTAASTSCTAVM
jgi:hypothetical protein